MPHPPNLPQTAQTDERNFPRHDPKAPYGQSGHPYPKMLHREFMPEDVEPWQAANVRQDKFSGPYYDSRHPRPRRVLPNGKVIPGDPTEVKATQDLIDAGYAQSLGEPVICRSAKDEEDIRVILGLPSMEEEAKAMSVKDLVKDTTQEELQRLRKQNEELEALLERNTELNRKIKDARSERVEMKQEAKEEKQKPVAPKKRGRPRKIVPLEELEK